MAGQVLFELVDLLHHVHVGPKRQVDELVGKLPDRLPRPLLQCFEFVNGHILGFAKALSKHGKDIFHLEEATVAGVQVVTCWPLHAELHYVELLFFVFHSTNAKVVGNCSYPEFQYPGTIVFGGCLNHRPSVLELRILCSLTTSGLFSPLPAPLNLPEAIHDCPTDLRGNFGTH